MPGQAVDELADTIAHRLRASAPGRRGPAVRAAVAGPDRARVSMHRRQRRYRLGYGGLVLWETGEVPVSMAGRTQATNPVTNSIYQQLGGRF